MTIFNALLIFYKLTKEYKKKRRKLFYFCFVWKRPFPFMQIIKPTKPFIQLTNLACICMCTERTPCGDLIEQITYFAFVFNNTNNNDMKGSKHIVCLRALYSVIEFLCECTNVCTNECTRIHVYCERFKSWGGWRCFVHLTKSESLALC